MHPAIANFQSTGPMLERLRAGLKELSTAHDGQIDQMRVKASLGPDNEVRLTLKTGKPGLMSKLKTRLFGEDVARNALRVAIGEALRSRNAINDPATTDAMFELMRMAARPAGGAIPAKLLLTHLDQVAGARTATEMQASAPANHEPTRELFAKALGSASFGNLANRLPDLRGSSTPQGVRDAWARELGDCLGAVVEDLEPLEQMTLLASACDQLTRDLKASLLGTITTTGQLNQIARMPDSAELLSDTLPKLIRKAIDQARTKLPDRSTGPTTVRHDGRDYSVPQALELHGETFTCVHPIAAGGFGIVCLYQDHSTPARKLAVKIPVPVADPGERRKQLKLARTETMSQLAATRDSANHAVAVRGVVPTPDGHGLIIAMDYAPHGDLQGLMRRLGAGDVAQDGPHDKQGFSLRATLAHDLLQGLRQLQRQGVSHLDLKGVNVMIGEGGMGQIADFGLAKTADMRDFSWDDKNKMGEERPDNPAWTDPRIRQLALEQEHEAKTLLADVTKKLKTVKDWHATVEAQIRQPDQGADLGRLRQTEAELRSEHGVLSARLKAMKATLPSHVQASGFAADRWSCAIVIFELFAGRLPVDTGWTANDEEQLLEIAQMPREQQRQTLFRDSAAKVPSAVQDLILDLMQADGPALDDILDSPVFRGQDVGSAATRERIVALASAAL